MIKVKGRLYFFNEKLTTKVFMKNGRYYAQLTDQEIVEIELYDYLNLGGKLED